MKTSLAVVFEDSLRGKFVTLRKEGKEIKGKVTALRFVGDNWEIYVNQNYSQAGSQSEPCLIGTYDYFEIHGDN